MIFYREYIPKSSALTQATWAPDYDPDSEVDDEVEGIDDESIRHGVTEFFPSHPYIHGKPRMMMWNVKKIFTSECGCSRNCFALVSSYKEHAHELLYGSVNSLKVRETYISSPN